MEYRDALLRGEEIEVDAKNSIIKAQLYSSEIGLEGARITFEDIHILPEKYLYATRFEFCDESVDPRFCGIDFWDKALIPSDHRIILIKSIKPKKDPLFVGEEDTKELVKVLRQVIPTAPICLLLSLSFSDTQFYNTGMLVRDREDKATRSKSLVENAREYLDILAENLGFEPLVISDTLKAVSLRKQDMDSEDPKEITIVSVYIRCEDAVRSNPRSGNRTRAPQSSRRPGKKQGLGATPPKRTHLELQEIEIVRRMYLEGVGVESIARSLDVSPTAVKRALQSLNLTKDDKPKSQAVQSYDQLTQPLKTQIADLYLTGRWTLRNLAKEFMITEGTLRKVLSEQGVSRESINKESEVSLDTRQKIFDMKIQFNYTNKTIAEYVGVSESTVKAVLEDMGL